MEVQTEVLVPEKQENEHSVRSNQKPCFWSKLKFPKTWSEVKKLGWKFVAGFILFYLVRDTILYLIIPYLIIKGVISF